MPEEQGKDYRWAGVDIKAADEAVELIKEKVSKTLRPEVMAAVGGFNSLFELDLERYKNPVIASGTDGVGTKLKLAQMLDKHDTVGSRCSSRTMWRPERSSRPG
jgi:phosphoribosylformylglycinamidine cyclo-ligase